MGRREPEDLDDRPKHQKKAKPAREKHFGLEHWSHWFNKWWHAEWYDTRRARDQAFESYERKSALARRYGLDVKCRKVER